MKATRKLIPALAMLLVAAVVMSSASYAWFTMSRQVTAQGMNVTVTAPNNLMIKEFNADDSTYAELTELTASNIVLVPASSTSGIAGRIYCVAPGQAVKPSDGSLFTSGDHRTKLTVGSAAESNTEGAYYDFKYTIKSDGGQEVKVVVKEVEATLRSTSPSGTSAVPVRIAVMKSDESGLHIFNPNSGKHHNQKENGHESDAPTAVTSIDGEREGYPTLANVTYTTPAANSGDTNFIVTLTDTAPTADIIIRVWYEGEDTDCIVAKGAKANFDIKVVLADVASLTPTT